MHSKIIFQNVIFLYKPKTEVCKRDISPLILHLMALFCIENGIFYKVMEVEITLFDTSCK